MMLIIESESRRRQQTLYQYYELSRMTASFVGCVFTGKQIPDKSEIFTELDTTAQDEAKMKVMLEQMKDYADWHNKHRGSGNGNK